jgi:DNA repair protein RadC
MASQTEIAMLTCARRVIIIAILSCMSICNPNNKLNGGLFTMYNYGQMSDRELVGILMAEKKGEFISEKLMKEFVNLSDLLANSIEEELMKIKGVGSSRAKQIKVCYELARRLQMNKAANIQIVKSPQDVAGLIMHEMRYLKKEVFRIILLNTKNHILSIEDISIGSLNSSIVHPREVYASAVKRSASGLIAVHNHPSGDPTPSQEDISTTNRLVQAGEGIGIKLLDHVIIGDGKFISLKEKGLI